MNIRKFQWQSIPIRQYKDSFWSKAQDEQDKGKNQVKIDFDLLQEMFCEEKKARKGGLCFSRRFTDKHVKNTFSRE